MDSMTGYGRGAARRDGREITVELKAVNHRFLDLSFRAPKNLSFLEDAFRSFLNESGVRRGHFYQLRQSPGGRSDGGVGSGASPQLPQGVA